MRRTSRARRSRFRLERLEAGCAGSGGAARTGGAGHAPNGERRPSQPAPDAIAVELEQLQEAWRRTILPAVEQRSIPIGKTLAEAHPAALAGDTLTLEFPQTASFHLKLAEDPKNAAMLRDALYEVTGRKLAVAFELGDGRTRAGARTTTRRARKTSSS